MAEEVVHRQYALHPHLEDRYSAGRAKCVADVAFHLAHLDQSLAAEEPRLFLEYARWARDLLVKRGIHEEDIAESFRLMAEVLALALPAPEGEQARQYVEHAAAALLPRAAEETAPGFTGSDRLTVLGRSYLAALLAGQSQEAGRLMFEATAQGLTLEELYIHILQVSQHEVGRLWQQNRINVAQEHYCTAATQHIMSQLYPQFSQAVPSGRRFAGASVAGDLHEVGVRMVSDFFQKDGWKTDFLGANVPTADLVRMVCDRRPDVLGISASLTPHIWAVEEMIAAVRAACRDVVILVGGRPFAIAPELAGKIGADGTCADAAGAVPLANELLEQRLRARA